MSGRRPTCERFLVDFAHRVGVRRLLTCMLVLLTIVRVSCTLFPIPVVVATATDNESLFSIPLVTRWAHVRDRCGQEKKEKG